MDKLKAIGGFLIMVYLIFTEVLIGESSNCFIKAERFGKTSKTSSSFSYEIAQSLEL